MKKIIINNLTIDELSEIMYGDKDTIHDFTTEQVNELLKSYVKELQAIYDSIDEENFEHIKPNQLYILGDVINMLNATKYRKPIKEPKNYKEQLEKARINNIDIIALEVADEVDCLFDNISKDHFEKACSLIKEACFM